MGGWAKIYRDIVRHPIYRDANASRLLFHLLLTVDYRSREDGGETLPPGSRRATIAELADETGMSVRQVRWAMDKLVEAGLVEWSTICRVGGVARVCGFGEMSEVLTKTLTKTLTKINESQTSGGEGVGVGTPSESDKMFDKKFDKMPTSTDREKEPKRDEEDRRQSHAHNACACACVRESDPHADVTPEMVRDAAILQGCNWTLETAELFLSHYRSIGWRLPNGALVTNWRMRIRAFDGYGRNLAARQSEKHRSQWDPKTIGKPEDFKEGFQILE